MELIRVKQKKADLRISKQELLIFNNALNEVCNALEVPEFETRMGASREEVDALLETVHKVFSAIDSDSDE
jgi:hypothetical protein